MLIVVIEEDVAMRALICEWLASAGHEARGLSTADGESVAAMGRADVVLASVRNLRAQGLDDLRRVRASFPGAAVIGLSTQLGRSLPADSRLALSLGVSGLIAKPFTSDELLGAVARTAGISH